MHKKNLTLTLAAVLLAGVLYISLRFVFDQDKPHKDLSDARINWDKVKTAKSFHDLFQPVEEIKLTGDMVGEIKQLIVFPNQKIIIRESKDVKLFDANGKFNKVIGRIGQGPGEYLKPNYVAIDESLNIYILDARSMKVTIFDSLGQHKHHLSLDTFVDEMAILGHRLYFYSATNLYRNYMACCYENPTGKRVFEFAPPTELLRSYKSNMIPPPFGIGEYLRVYREKIYIAHPYEYTIREFSLRGKELQQIKGKSCFFVPSNPAKKFNPTVSPAEFFGSLIKSVLIWNDLIFVFFGNLSSHKIYIDIFTLDGEQVNESSIVFKGHNAAFGRFFLTSASNGYFYSYYQPEPKSPIDLANPIIIKYKFLPFISTIN